MFIEMEHQCDKDAGEHNVSESEHGKLEWTTFREVFGKHDFDWAIERFCDGDHHISAKHPEDVIEKESTQQDGSQFEAWQSDQFNTNDGKGLTKEVSGDPISCDDVPESDESGEEASEQGDEGNLDGGWASQFGNGRNIELEPGVIQNTFGSHTTSEGEENGGESRDAQCRKVETQEQIDEFWGEKFEEQIEAKEDRTAHDGKHVHILGR